MNSDLLGGLVSKPQRETAGSDSASRFDYQKNWGFCEMLRRHMSGADYLVAFEFHDDVVFLTPSSAPDSAEFFQVKTAKSATPRKLASLTARNSKTTNSILGKMFTNFTGICSTHKIKVILVSNIAFEFAGTDLCAKDLEPKYRDKIIEQLKTELSNFSEGQVDSLHFVITGVSIDAMHSYLHGEATASEGLVPANVKTIALSDELHLLQKSQYADVMERIGGLHEETLAADTSSS